ncbi:MAG: hypothetical protein PHO07_06265 [Pirellulales bacterium]|jgi:hypothetical protein|nr:hypothetical protein [Thermoguttaceae bacterium]MDD4786764.1 hypothetical protein [Pirellulales bacterium]MDI9444408.1 hypothetical protein [Planctomycetota bacterium]NLZ00724.1 hypothetical protein [Pirellulaceae bacterium]
MTTDAESAPLRAAAHRHGLPDRGGDAPLFPLPLVPFERYMVADDRRGYPMTFPVRVELEGQLCRDALEAALADAIARHPLLNARLRRRRFRRHWVAGADPVRLHWETTGAATACLPGQPLDLASEPGVRIACRVEDHRVTLSLLFHHAACDGIGALRFIGDVLAFYGRRTSAEDIAPNLLPIEPANLLDRGRFDIRLPAVVSARDVLLSTLREGWKVLARRPQVLISRCRLGNVAASPLYTAGLDAQTYGRFCRRANDAGVTVNDLLLRDMFLTVRAWNDSRSRRRVRGWLRITMPTSLRGRRAARMPATNSLGYAFVTRRTDECDRPGELLTGLGVETKLIRDWGLGALFVEALRKARLIPGLTALGARFSRRFSTVVLSNLGDPIRRFRARFPCNGDRLQAGNLRLQRIYGAPPVRPGTRAAIALFSYGNELTLAMIVDPRWFSPEDAAAFLHQYQSRLNQSADEEQPDVTVSA